MGRLDGVVDDGELALKSGVEAEDIIAEKTRKNGKKFCPIIISIRIRYQESNIPSSAFFSPLVVRRLHMQRQQDDSDFLLLAPEVRLSPFSSSQHVQ